MELSYHIPFHIPRFLAEIHTDSHQVLSIQRKKNQIPFFVNLAQRIPQKNFANTWNCGYGEGLICYSKCTDEQKNPH